MRKVLTVFIWGFILLNFAYAQSSKRGNFEQELLNLQASIDLDNQKSIISKELDIDPADVEGLEVLLVLGPEKRVEAGGSGENYKYFNFKIVFKLNCESAMAKIEESMKASRYFERSYRNSKTYYTQYFNSVLTMARNRLILKLKDSLAKASLPSVNIDSTERETSIEFDSGNVSQSNTGQNSGISSSIEK